VSFHRKWMYVYPFGLSTTSKYFPSQTYRDNTICQQKQNQNTRMGEATSLASSLLRINLVQRILYITHVIDPRLYSFGIESTLQRFQLTLA
jgi:hypothetical protein